MGKAIRLDKFLSEMNKGSRSQLREAARQGRITVNGQVERKTDRKIDPEADQVCLDRIPVSYRAFEYYMLNKPQGVVSATEDARHKTVVELLQGSGRQDLFPVGRLDIDTEGLLLLTNDGALAHRLLAPGKHVDKQYFAQIEGRLPGDAALQMEAGMTLEDQTKLLPARLEILSRGHGDAASQILLTIHEGKFHQVKRMFETLGCRVVFLKRMSMGPLRLDEGLKPGQYRPLTNEELELLGVGKGEEKP